MKNILLIFLPLLMVSVLGCRNEEDLKASQDVYLLENDSLSLVHISEVFKTQSAGYPRPWSVDDRSTWEGTIVLDTIIDTDTGKNVLAVGEITLYIVEPSERSPMDIWLERLAHVHNFKLFACPGATIEPSCIPIGCDSILIDKIDYNVPGYINVGLHQNMNGNAEYCWETSEEMDKKNWAFSKVEIHWVNMTSINYVVKYTAEQDLSYNQLSGWVDQVNTKFIHRVNLSHNNYTGMRGSWDWWIASPDENVPNLQYNDLEIPEYALDTDFWRKNHEWFIGNPGYQAPK